MKPLREELNSTDPLVAEGARLLSAIGPLQDSTVSAERVRRALNRRAEVRRPSRLVWLLSGTVVFVASAALAAFGAGVFGPKSSAPHPVIEVAGRPAASSEFSASSRPPAHSQLPAHSQPPARVESPARSEPSVQPPVHSQLPAHSERSAYSQSQREATSHVEGQRDVMQRSKSAPTPSAATGLPKNVAQGAASSSSISEVQLMQKAVEALRGEKDADKAEQLLAKYRDAARNDQLAEEALALSIEIALLKNDPRAKEYGRKYLAKYPQGNFAPLARKAILP